MNLKLFFEALIKFLLGFILVGITLFLSAGSFNYTCGWLFMGLLFIPMFIAGLIMMVKNPNLLRSRLNAKEKEDEQRVVVTISAFMFLIGYVLAGLNYRFNLYHFPKVVILIASIVFIISYILYAEILRENTYLSRTIEVQKNQRVIDTGLYKIVRHPMYFATLFLFLSMPIILDSPLSFIVFLIYPIVIKRRIENEEEVLEKNLKGYKEYKNEVKYRLIPFIW